MNNLEIRGLTIARGSPKIAVSVRGETQEEILEISRGIDLEKVDLVEWRADFFREVSDAKGVLDILKDLRVIFIDTPIIFTLRSLKEGGERTIAEDYYIQLNKIVAESQIVDIIDIEVSSIDRAKNLIDWIHDRDLVVIGSSHDFFKTPSEEDMITILENIEESGADILKLAVMPKTSRDVIKLLSITDAMKFQTKKPLITISMGELGTISRISGKIFGSSITFGSLDRSSAPGQIALDKLYDILN